ncbi:MAG: hypothetical protein OXB94_10970 [Nitrospira sp.]|nr:hypothetical protein [Nitrospira sp.]
MENALRFVIVFLWCVGFGFFSVMGYLDDTMTGQKSTAILAGLLAGLGVYCAIEWRPKIKGLSIRAGWNKFIDHRLYAQMSRGIRAFLPLCAQMLRKVRASVTSINLPMWGSIKKRFLPTSKPPVSSKSLP